MKKIIFALILIIGCLTICKAQVNLNEYKYVIVPNKFNFLKSNDQFQLNSLTKFLFNKYGFNTIMVDEEYPSDLASNPCLSLKADVENLRGFLKTKLVIVLKNCKNETVFTSEVGETKEKEYKKAYHLALRDAFKSFEAINYSYSPKVNNVEVSVKTNSTSKNNIVTPINTGIATVTVAEKEVISNKSVAEEVLKEDSKQSNILYAQVIENGFQLVDSTPKVVMILLTTPKQDTFIVKGKDAIVYKEDGFWYISQNDGKNYSTKLLNIKF